MSEVPTSAPSMMASAGPSVMRDCETKELVMSAVALEDCTRLVTPRPAMNAEKRLVTLFERTRRRSAPYTRRIPVRTMCVPHTSRATLATRFRSVCTSSGRNLRPNYDSLAARDKPFRTPMQFRTMAG